MTASRQKKKVWEKKLTALTDAKTRAIEDELVAVYEARQDGLSQTDVAYMLGGVHPTGIKAKADKGKAILAERQKRRVAGNA